jgi:hypothetical protein
MRRSSAPFGTNPFDLLTTVAVTFWYTWLFNRTSGSMLITIIMAHATEGSIQTEQLRTQDCRGANGLTLCFRVARGCDRVGGLRLEGMAQLCAHASGGTASL